MLALAQMLRVACRKERVARSVRETGGSQTQRSPRLRRGDHALDDRIDVVAHRAFTGEAEPLGAIDGIAELDRVGRLDGLVELDRLAAGGDAGGDDRVTDFRRHCRVERGEGSVERDELGVEEIAALT